MQNVDDHSPNPETIHRSRWGRFSPSMGWKAFWSEIVIVILGVLIALAANEAVQNWNWRNKVQDGEVRVDVNMRRSFALAAEQYAVVPCVQAQLAELTKRLMQSGEVLDSAPIYEENGRIFTVQLPLRLSRFAVWEMLVADGTAAHFPLGRQLDISYINESNSKISEASQEANRKALRLLTLGRSLKLSDDARRSFLVDIDELRSLTAMKPLAQWHMRTISRFGTTLKEEDVQKFLAESPTVKFCKAHNYPLADWRDALKPEAR